MREESDHIRDEIFEEIENLSGAEQFGPAQAERLITLLQAYHEARVKELEAGFEELRSTLENGNTRSGEEWQ